MISFIVFTESLRMSSIAEHWDAIMVTVEAMGVMATMIIGDLIPKEGI